MEKQRITYIPQGGVCSKMMIVDIADGKIENAQVIADAMATGRACVPC